MLHVLRQMHDVLSNCVYLRILLKNISWGQICWLMFGGGGGFISEDADMLSSGQECGRLMTCTVFCFHK